MALLATCWNDFNKNDELHLMDRYFWNPGVEYTIPLNSYGPGDFQVNLMFAEWQFSQINERIFDIVLNQVTVDTGVDIFDEAGGKLIEVVKTYNVSISPLDLNLHIWIKQVKNHARISAIEIIPTDVF